MSGGVCTRHAREILEANCRLSLDVRENVIDGGVSRRKAAAQFDIGVTTAIRCARQTQITGSVAPGRMGGDRRSHRFEAHADFLRGEIDANPRVTIMELREKLKDHHGMSFGYATIWRFLARHKFTHKRTTAHAAEQDREVVAAARDAWFERQIVTRRGVRTPIGVGSTSQVYEIPRLRHRNRVKY